ncbi:hypothetical protein BSL78_06386 [Apostichopus japonicus]|uniref:HAUS augmin-like complex subunit 6 N-terminal domain-containing protein n=1 Tax=Stichopus japonicus TaxID=307972 RepID=A0A2G8L928_STIJA|nr:hypothetical protein BSL78_06386 [Apostichopus japonicus]
MDRLNKTKDDISSKPLDTREIVYTSLLLLGFVPREMEDKYNIPFTRDMFSLPNKRGFEVVMQFLFERLNPALSRERFRHCWPILDKKQEQTFRKTISNWLTEISKEDEDANLPRIVPSLFMSPGGDKFYTLLFYFTSFVMVKTCKNDHGVKSRDLLHHCTMTANTRQYAPVMAQTILASTVTPRKKFLNVTQETVHLQRQWKEYANDLVKAHRSLCKRIRELEHSIKEEESKMITNAGSSVVSPGVGLRVRSSGMTDGEWDVLAVKRAQRIQKVRDLWQSVKVCCQEQADERAVVDSVTSERSKKDRLDAGDLPVQVPEILLRECEQEIQRRRINNVYDGGKLDLVSLIKLWNLSLRLYLEKLNEAPVPDFEERMPSVVTQVHMQNSHLANARALRNSLAEEVLPDLQKSVSQLLKYNEDGVELPTRDRMVKASPHHEKGWGYCRQLHPCHLNLQPHPRPEPLHYEKTSSLFTKSPENVGTPEVMTKLRESVMETALKKAGLAQGTPTSTLREVRIPSKRERKIPVPAKTKDFSRQRYKSATSERDTQETPVSTKSKTSSRKDGTFRHPSNKRMVQTTVKKKKRPSSFQRPSETFQQPVTRAHSNRDVQEPEDGRETTFGSLTQNQPTVDRAQSKLIEQIVESVVSSSSERSSPTLTPEMLSGDNSSSVPILAVEDPLRALDCSRHPSYHVAGEPHIPCGWRITYHVAGESHIPCGGESQTMWLENHIPCGWRITYPMARESHTPCGWRITYHVAGESLTPCGWRITYPVTEEPQTLWLENLYPVTEEPQNPVAGESHTL